MLIPLIVGVVDGVVIVLNVALLPPLIECQITPPLSPIQISVAEVALTEDSVAVVLGRPAVGILFQVVPSQRASRLAATFALAHRLTGGLHFLLPGLGQVDAGIAWKRKFLRLDLGSRGIHRIGGRFHDGHARVTSWSPPPSGCRSTRSRRGPSSCSSLRYGLT